MKFPLPKNIFPPLELSENQEQNYEQLASSLIKATLAEYDQFVMHDRKRVDSKRWKPVRSRDEIAIYRERLVDGVKKASPANLALYQSAISTTSSRPSQNRRPGSESSDLASYRTTSFNAGRSFGPPASPKKSKSMDPTEDSRDTTGNDSYSSNGLPSEPRITTAAFSSTDDHSDGLPRMLAVGNLRGSLDDVMYGIVSPNASSVRLRSSYLGEYIADCAVLKEIKRPSPSDPFRFLGIKWFVRAKHRGAARIVLPRDFVVLEFSGVMMRPDNSRVGFHLMHSVQIPTCRELHEHRILRAKVSSCYIFEETRTNRVQVFMTASVDPSGHVLPRLALRSAATALSNCWKSVACAHNKKLAYCLQNERPSSLGASVITSSRGGHALGTSAIRSSRGGLSALTPVNESAVRESSTPREPVSQRSNYNATANRRQCGVCRGKLGVMSKTTLCQLCCEQTCSRCRIVRKLSSDTLSSQITQSTMTFCKKCVASVSDESALEIARQELWDTRSRGRGRTRASSAVSRASSRHSFSSERNTYMTVVLGRGSEMNSRGSTSTSSLGLSRGPNSLSASRGPNQEENALGFSVGPRPSNSTPSSTPQTRPSSGGRMSKPFSLNMSAGPLSTNTLQTDALSLADLDMERASAARASAKKEETEGEEPVVLDHRMTLTIRSLRHLDYVLSVGESDLVNELDNEYQSEGEEDLMDVETEDEGRSSYASSVAVMDDGYESCDTPTSDMVVNSQREAPIVEEDDEGHHQEDQKAGEKDQKADEEVKAEETPVETEISTEISSPEEPYRISEVVPAVEQPEQVAADAVEQNDKAMETVDVEEKAEQSPEEALVEAVDADEVEVVEANPIAEVHATMLSEYMMEKPKATPQEQVGEVKSRLHRAHTTVPSSGENYQHQLFQQMQDLHSVAETTYQVARANTEAAFKERDSGRMTKGSPTRKTESLRGVHTFSQPFAFNVVGLRSTRAMTVGMSSQ